MKNVPVCECVCVYVCEKHLMYYKKIFSIIFTNGRHFARL